MESTESSASSSSNVNSSPIVISDSEDGAKKAPKQQHAQRLSCDQQSKLSEIENWIRNVNIESKDYVVNNVSLFSEVSAILPVANENKELTGAVNSTLQKDVGQRFDELFKTRQLEHRTNDDYLSANDVVSDEDDDSYKSCDKNLQKTPLKQNITVKICTESADIGDTRKVCENDNVSLGMYVVLYIVLLTNIF